MEEYGMFFFGTLAHVSASAKTKTCSLQTRTKKPETTNGHLPPATMAAVERRVCAVADDLSVPLDWDLSSVKHDTRTNALRVVLAGTRMCIRTRAGPWPVVPSMWHFSSLSHLIFRSWRCTSCSHASRRVLLPARPLSHRAPWPSWQARTSVWRRAHVGITFGSWRGCSRRRLTRTWPMRIHGATGTPCSNRYHTSLKSRTMPCARRVPTSSYKASSIAFFRPLTGSSERTTVRTFSTTSRTPWRCSAHPPQRVRDRLHHGKWRPHRERTNGRVLRPGLLRVVVVGTVPTARTNGA